MYKQREKKLLIQILAIIFLMGITQFSAFAQDKQSGIITGRVLNADGQPEENVILVLMPSGKQTGSDDNGHFEFRNIPYGEYTISVKSLGVTAEPVTVELNFDKVSVQDIQLAENATVLDRVIVTNSYRHVNKNSSQVARLPLSYIENPQNYSVIPKELLNTQIITNTEQALLNIPGVSNMSVVGGSGGSSLTFKSRGFSSGSVIYRNGVSTGYVALTDLFNVERIEAIKGPSATLFGGNQGASYGGVYNMITRQPLDVKRGEISFSTGSYELARATVDYNTPLNDDKTALLRLNAVYDNRNTFQELPQNTVGLAPSLLIKATDRLTLHFDGYYFRSSRPIILFGFNPPPGGGSGSTNYQGNVKTLGLDIKNAYAYPDFNSTQQTLAISGMAEYKLSDKWISQTNFSVARNNNNTQYISLLAKKKADDDTTWIQRSVLNIPNSQLYTQQFQQNFIGDFNIGSLRNRLLVGLDYFKTNVFGNRASALYDSIYTTASTDKLWIKEARVDSLFAKASYPGNRAIANSYGAYVSEVLNITDRLLLMASLRINRYVTNNGDFMQTSYSPKIGLSYEIIKNALSIYGNYNNGYNNVTGTDSLGNLLKPEYANQLEGGIKFDVLQHRLAGTVSIYDINVKNKSRAVPGTNYSIQDNEQKSRGVDVDILANPIAGLNIALGYGYNDVRYSKFNGAPVVENGVKIPIEGNKVESSPYHAGNIWATYQFTKGRLKGFGLGAGGNGQSKSYTNITNTINLDGFFVSGASVFYNALKFRLGAKIDNIANKKYYTYNSWLFAGQPRMLTFNITYRF